MSGPDTPRWLSDISDELRQEVPVRDTWRAQLLEDIAHSRHPLADDPPTVRDRRGRHIVLGPWAALAAAVVFAALGAAATLVIQAKRTAHADIAQSPASRIPGGPATPASDATVGAAREVVHFELSAPNASRVALVGSFNGWDPVATPLHRDVGTGKWAVSLRLPPGRHVYAFVVDGDITVDPAAPRAADDDFGSANSVVLVSGPRT